MGTIALHVVPRARATAVAGTHGDAIKVRVAAPPVDGAANEELVRFVAACLGVPAGHVKVVGGASGRRKTIAVSGIESVELRRALLSRAAP